MTIITHNKPSIPPELTVELIFEGDKLQYIESGDFEPKVGNHLTIFGTSNTGDITRTAYIGMGDKTKLGVQHIEKIAKAILTCSKAKTIEISTSFVSDMNHYRLKDFTQELAKHLISKTYVYSTTKSDFKDNSPKSIYMPFSRDINVETGVSIGRAMNRAKYLGDLPSNICTPGFLEEYALSYINENVKVTSFGEEEMLKNNMGAMLSVTKGSEEEGKVIIMKYNGATDENEQPIVLIGKAVTFDSGGISIKPSAKMEEMKYDMCGGATVIAVLSAAAEMKLPVNIIGLVGAVENMPSGKASKPGDVITSMSGKTIEITNTDAEGRLVLCDLITYAEQFHNPRMIIDMATLTGACVGALGEHATGLFCEDERLTQDLLKSGIKSHDRCWHLPMWEEYDKQMDSKFADVINSGKPGAGASTAACFLKRFTSPDKYKWAHLDIAGTAIPATGRPVALLLEYLMAFE